MVYRPALLGPKPYVNIVEKTFRRLDRFQQTHKSAGLPFAVIQKFGNDSAGGLATQVAYQGLFALFPLLLLMATVLGFVLAHDSHLKQSVISSAVADFPIIGPQLRQSAQPLKGSGLALTVGIIGTVYGSMGLAQSVQVAMNRVWNVPYVVWPNFFLRRVRGVAILFLLGVSVLLSGGLSGFATTVAGGWAVPLGYAGSTAINFGVFLVAFMVLTAQPLGWRDVWLGALLSTVFWEVLQAFGTLYMAHELKGASETYGFFAIVIALLSWIYIAAQLTLLAAEINVVVKYRLWPRSMTQPPLIEGDRKVFERLAQMEVRRPEYEIGIGFKPAADSSPGMSEGPQAQGEGPAAPPP